MRNGNSNKKPKAISASDYVLILPMRNGNPNSKVRSNLDISGSYPTYEEWKPCKGY